MVARIGYIGRREAMRSERLGVSCQGLGVTSEQAGVTSKIFRDHLPPPPGFAAGEDGGTILCLPSFMSPVYLPGGTP